MKITETPIPGLLVIEPQVFEDRRGYFMETFSQREFLEKTGLDVNFVQDNESCSSEGVVRGLHFQKPPFEQAKLVRCTFGKIVDMVLDLRPGSSTFGNTFAIELSAENRLQLFIPKGFAHGFAVISSRAVFQYKCDEFYHPEAEGGVNILSPSLVTLRHYIPASPVFSDKDMKLPEWICSLG